MKTFVLSDESLNTYGFWILTSGCDLTQFEKNPLMLWNHNRAWLGKEDEVLPIGHWENIRVEGNQILADAVFDTDPFSAKIAAKVEAGTLRMASIGFSIIEESEDSKYIKQGQRYATVLKCKIKEASIVDIGSNNNALALYDADDKLIELSSGSSEIPLKMLNSKQDSQMKEVQKLLKLSDTATEQDYIAAISPIITENTTLRDEKKALQDKLDAIELAEKNAKKGKAKNLIAAAIKDGRLNDDEKHTSENFWLKNFETDFELASAELAKLPKRKDVRSQLNDNSSTGESAWAKRQAEIDQNTKRK